MSEARQPTEQPHRNHGLFSDHYLGVTLPERPQWKGLIERARPVKEEISRVFDAFTPSDNEAQTERGLVRPVLDLLGHDYEVQPALETPDGTKRPDYVYKWYEIQDSVDYYAAFEKPKILWPDIAKLPRFSWDAEGFYLGNTGYIAVPEHPWLLGFLASRCAWFLISRTAIALGERTGANRHRLIDQYMRPLPIPDVSADAREVIGTLAMEITELARDRYELHQKMRRRILSDLGAPGKKLNQKLTVWWNLGFPAFRAEIKKVFKKDIPLAERDEWEEWLAERRAENERLTAEIVRLETELNARVYNLFDLTPEEIRIIEESTKYRYGEV